MRAERGVEDVCFTVDLLHPLAPLAGLAELHGEDSPMPIQDGYVDAIEVNGLSVGHPGWRSEDVLWRGIQKFISSITKGLHLLIIATLEEGVVRPSSPQADEPVVGVWRLRRFELRYLPRNAV